MKIYSSWYHKPVSLADQFLSTLSVVEIWTANVALLTRFDVNNSPLLHVYIRVIQK